MHKRKLAVALAVFSLSTQAHAQSLLSDELPVSRDDELPAPEDRNAEAPAPSSDGDLALAQASMGRLVEARASCARALRFNASDDEVLVKRCEALVADLDARIPLLVVNVRGLPPGTPVSVSVDGEALDATSLGRATRRNPGLYVVTALALGHTVARQEVRLREGEAETVTLEPAPFRQLRADQRPPVREPSLPTYGAVGFGVAGVGAFVFGVGALVATATVADVRSRCAAAGCYGGDVADDLSRARLYANAANVGALAALAGGSVGLFALLDRPKAAAARSFAPYVNTAGAGVNGHF